MSNKSSITGAGILCTAMSTTGQNAIALSSTGTNYLPFLLQNLLESFTITEPPQCEDQTWFLTEEWQMGEREADKDIANGDVFGPFDNIPNLLMSLKEHKN